MDTDVAVDPANLNVMFATNYSSGSDAATVSMTVDGGTNWTDISGNLNPIGGGHFQSILYIEGPLNDVLVVGAGQGAFASFEPFGGCWFELGQGLPNTIAHDLAYDRADDRLVVGMYGRGAWTMTGAANLVAPVIVLSPNGGEPPVLAGCPMPVTWTAGEGFEDEILNILFSNDGGQTWVTLLTNTPNDGNDIVILPCEATTQGRIKIETSDQTFCDISDANFTVVFPTLSVIASVNNTFTPPDPWVQDGLVIDSFVISSTEDLFNVRFVADPLQCTNLPCETNHVKRIHEDLVEFVPEVIGYIPANTQVTVEIKTTVPIGQHACTYRGEVHVIAKSECLCPPELVAEFDNTLTVDPVVDVDVADNGGNVSDNYLHVKGAKLRTVTGTFVVINPNSEAKNSDPEDGPGNLRINPTSVTVTDLVKIGDLAVAIPLANVTIDPLISLASGEAQEVGVSILIPDGVPVNAFYEGTVEVFYESCLGGSPASDRFTLQLEVLPTQGILDIIQTELSEDFCPEDPWTMVGQVAFSFDVHANGDHRNIRVASGGLKHKTLDKKLDLFNFYPEEIAFLAAGETRTINVITKIPIGQHSGNYADYFRVVSENAGEDSVHAEINICKIYDMDIQDGHANVDGNVMIIQAYSRANKAGGHWSLRGFDVGLPSNLDTNDDEYDGPGNTPIDCVTCEFEAWSPMWHEDDPSHNLHSKKFFTGVGSVIGETCGDWGSGTFKRLMVGLYVPEMKANLNMPGTYKGRLNCWAIGSGGETDTVSTDFFDIEVKLARVVGSGLDADVDGDPNFGGYPTILGAELYWGTFTDIGMDGPVNLYRQGPDDAGFVKVNPSPLSQRSTYVDRDVAPGETYVYRLGVQGREGELLIGPLTIGGTPKTSLLSQNAPNPFGSQTTIAYELAEAGRISLQVFDISGRRIRVLENRDQPAGFYTVIWDGRDDSGRASSTGMYFYRLTGPGFTATKKMILVR